MFTSLCKKAGTCIELDKRAWCFPLDQKKTNLGSVGTVGGFGDLRIVQKQTA